MIQRSLSAALTLLLFLISHFSYAQTAILFQIPSSSSQIEVAASVGDAAAVKAYKRSDNQIKHAIMRNFKAEFSYCPVYFFSVEDYDKVKDKKLTEVQFYDNEGKETSLPKDLDDYRLANISFFPKVVYEAEGDVPGERILKEGSENRYGKGIILYDKNFKPLNGKMRFTPCRVFKRGSIFKKNKRYYDFNGALALDRKLRKHGWMPKSSQ